MSSGFKSMLYFIPRDYKLRIMAEAGVELRNFHEMELDDRILKVNTRVVTRVFIGINSRR
jgi:hypothetical protein